MLHLNCIHLAELENLSERKNSISPVSIDPSFCLTILLITRVMQVASSEKMKVGGGVGGELPNSEYFTMRTFFLEILCFELPVILYYG